MSSGKMMDKFFTTAATQLIRQGVKFNEFLSLLLRFCCNYAQLTTSQQTIHKINFTTIALISLLSSCGACVLIDKTKHWGVERTR